MMTRPLNRPIVPKLPAHAFKTYQISAPLKTHWRRATCAEVECPGYTSGWSTLIDETDETGQQRAYYIRKRSGRSFREVRVGPGMTRFNFPPGQRCFRSDDHRIRIDRPELFVVRGGDWRGNPRQIPVYRHTSPESWVDDFGSHQQTLADRLAQG